MTTEPVAVVTVSKDELESLIRRVVREEITRLLQPAVSNNPHTASSNAQAFLDRLEAHGYYRYAALAFIPQLKQEARLSGRLLGWQDTGRVYHADSEDLAEGCAWEFLERLCPFLYRLGVPKFVISQVFDNDVDYTVTVNDQTYTILTVAEETHLELNQRWRLGTERTFTIVNDLLEQAGSDERVYQLFDGNDTHAIFLTPQLYYLIKESHLLPDEDCPKVVVPNRL
ncbi:MAG: hypothetical protein MUD01_14940 [Chloroflexaceae bacterium]|jgi:hypothetical protein|nr:hypothetical protein [Chloroflexaceae bacterium]